MKKLTLLLAATLMLMGSNTFALNSDSVLILQQQKEIGYDLTKNLVYPSIAKAELIEGIVSVSIKLEENGRLNVLAINGNPKLIILFVR